VAGFDDIEQAASTSYDLTTFAQPVEAIAGQAVKSLEHSPIHETRRVQLHANLVWRGSMPGAGCFTVLPAQPPTAGMAARMGYTPIIATQ
jgi:hypothetical protein